jgi:hypothetical protein
MPFSRNILFLIIGALIVGVGVLGYNLYQTKKQPEGLQINVGPNGLKIQNKWKNAPAMKTSRIKLVSILLLGGLMVPALADTALADQVAREQDIVNLRLGQRIRVDDGTCPPGQVKEVSGSKMSSKGVLGSRKCVPRLGPKTK